MVETSGLENRQAERSRGFESHLLRYSSHHKEFSCAEFRILGAIMHLYMARAVFFEWEAPEYVFEQKGSDWYWALGIIAIAGMVASILFGNLILALLIAAATGALALSTAKDPRTHVFRVTDEGVMIDENIYEYEHIISFSVLEYIDPTLPPALSLKTHRVLAPHLLIPIVGPDPVELYDFLADHIDEGKHDESAVDRIIELFRL